MAKTKEKNKLNPRQLAVKEQKKMKGLVIGFIVTGVVIVGLIAYAVIYSVFIRDNIPVATVDGKKIDNEYYKARVRLERNGYIQQFMMLNAQAQFFAEDPNQASYLEEQMRQVASSLDNVAAFGEAVLNNMIEDQIIVVKGQEMGLDVSDEEIDAFFEQIFSYFPDGTPTPAPTLKPFTTPEISPTQEAILQLEPTSVIDSLEINPEGEVDGIVDGEEKEATPTLAATPTAGPTATPFTEEMFQTELNEYLENLESINVSEKHMRSYLYQYLMRIKVQEALNEQIPTEQEQVWARHILVATESEAQEVIDRLESGEKWPVIAAEVSLDTSNKDNGGDLGWFSDGQMVADFSDAAFALDIGQISAPVETQFGWHVIQLVDRAVLPLSASDLQLKQNLEFQQWLADAKENIPYKINDVYRDLTPADPSLYDLFAEQDAQPEQEAPDTTGEESPEELNEEPAVTPAE